MFAIANVVQSSNSIPPRANTPRINYMPLGEPIESTVKKLIQTNVITLLEVKAYELAPFKLTRWNSNDFCEYHCTIGHKTSSCYKLKNLIQDLIDHGDITVDTNRGFVNTDHTIFKDPFVKHDKGKASSSGTQDNTTNYTKVAYDYTINTISAGDEIVAAITINPWNCNCAVVTHRSRVTLQGFPSNPLPPM